MLDTKKEWSFNLDAILEFVCQKEGRRRTDSNIEEVYKVDEEGVKDPKLVEKKITEYKNSDFTAREAMRFDLVKWLMDGFDSIEIDEMGEALFDTIGQKASFNTLYEYGFINEE